ncbi:MAG: PAS domain S-box protein, partial [Syntrophobacteraceae bacterium]
KFRSYVEHAPLAVFVSDGEGRLVDCNPSALRMLDYDVADLTGKTILDLHPEEDREEALRAFSILVKRGHVEGELRLKKRDGNPIWVSLNAVMVTDRLALGYVMDITDHKRNERERELTIEFLRLMQETENRQELVAAAVTFFKERSGCEAVGIRLKEEDDYPYLETRGFPPGFVQAENSLCSGGESNEIPRDNLGNPVLACMCGSVIRGRFDPSKPFFTENGSFWTGSTSKLLAETTEADRQARTRNRCNGEGYESVALIPLDAGAKALGLIQINDRRKGCFTAEDIGLWERLAGYLAVALAKFDSEEKLRESEEEFQTMFEKASIGMAQTDMVTGRLLRVNRKMCEITGYTAAELLTMGFMDITHPEDRQRNWDAYKDRAKNATKDYRLEKRYIRKNGEIVWVSVNSTVIRDSSGQPRRTFAAIEDISERKRAEELLSRQEMMLRETAEIAHVGGWEFDPISREGNWTEQTARIHDVDPQVNPDVTFGMSFYLGESRGRIETAVREAIELAKPYDLELEMVSAKGAHKWVRSICHPVVSDGRVVKVRGSIQDITERRQAEEALRRSLDEKVALLKEVHHRVKNNLQIVSSLLGLQMGRSEDQKVLDVLKDTRSRVRSMALLHETLYRSGNLARVNFAAYLRDLCGQLRLPPVRWQAVSGWSTMSSRSCCPWSRPCRVD